MGGGALSKQPAGLQKSVIHPVYSLVLRSKAGISTSAERRLPFVHRFRGLPPPAGLPAGQTREQQSAAKAAAKAAKMSNYETNPVGALQERFQSRGIVPIFSIIQSEGASHCPIFTYQVTRVIRKLRHANFNQN